MNESTLWLALGWTMLHSLWSGLALGVLVALGRLALWRARPALRYGFLCASLALLAALPVVLFALAPASPVRLGGGAGQAASVSLFGLGEASARSWTRALIPWLPWVWTLGSSLYLVLLLRGLAGTSRLRRRACAELERVDLSARCRSLARELGVARRVVVRVCDEVASPLVVGIARPLIVLPAAAIARCTPEQVEMVLLHELAHVRRWDNLVQLAQRVVQAVLFYQPAVWLVSSWIDLEREHCCDAVVLARTKRPRAYAQTLLALADAQRGAPALALSMAKRPLLARIERILRTKEPTGMQAKTTALALAAALAILWTTLAPLSPAEAGPQRYARVQRRAPSAPEYIRAQHPIGLPAGTDCSACHVTPVAGPNPHEPDVFAVHEGLPASAKCSDCHVTSSSPAPAVPQSNELDRLRAQERELRRLLGEVERLRAELEALRGGSSARSRQESSVDVFSPPGDSLTREYYLEFARVRRAPNTQLPSAAPQPTNPLRLDRLRYAPGAPLPAPRPEAAPRVRTRYLPGATLPEPAPRMRVPRSGSLIDTRVPAPAGLPRRATIHPQPQPQPQPQPADAPPEPAASAPVPILSDLPLLSDLFEATVEPEPEPESEPEARPLPQRTRMRQGS